MYNDYFGFDETPFGVEPDLHFFYNNPGYAKASANLLYGIRERKGFQILTGLEGTGKTLFLRRFIATHGKNFHCIPFSVTASHSEGAITKSEDILDDTCEALELDVKKLSYAEKVKTFQGFLKKQSLNKKALVLLIDDAHHLDESTLAKFVYLFDFRSADRSVAQVVLVGLPELEAKLRQPTLSRLWKQLAITSRLEPLASEEVGKFINHRLAKVGYRRNDLFSAAAIDLIATYTEGVPGLINRLCDTSLLAASLKSCQTISAEIVEDTARQHRIRKVNSRRPAGDKEPPSSGLSPAPAMATGQRVDVLSARRLPWSRMGIAASLVFAAGLTVAVVAFRPEPFITGAKYIADPYPGKPSAREVTQTDRAPTLTQIIHEGPAEKAKLLGASAERQDAVNYAKSEPNYSHIQAIVESSPEHKAAPAAEVQITRLTHAESVKQERALGERVNPLPERLKRAQSAAQQDEAVTTAVQTAIIDTKPWKAVEPSTEQRDHAPEAFARQASERHLTELLARADRQFAARRLTTPGEDNALATYREILRLMPGHAEATKGIDRIKQQYRVWAEAAILRTDWRKAQTYYERALRLDPKDGTLIAALNRIPQQSAPQNNKPLPSSSASSEARPASKPESVRQAAVGEKQSAAVLTDNAKQGYSQAVATLIAEGISPDAADEKGKTGLMWAASRGHIDTVGMLLSKGADVNKLDVDGDTALAFAAWGGHAEIARLLLSHGASINTKNQDGRTALINACINGHDAVVKLLLARGARLYVSDKGGRTPLMAAAWNGHASVVEILIDNGANLNASNHDGWTALIYSAWKGYENIVKLLVARGANVAIKNNDDNTASMVATLQGYEDIAQLLR